MPITPFGVGGRVGQNMIFSRGGGLLPQGIGIFLEGGRIGQRNVTYKSTDS